MVRKIRIFYGNKRLTICVPDIDANVDVVADMQSTVAKIINIDTGEETKIVGKVQTLNPMFAKYEMKDGEIVQVNPGAYEGDNASVA